MSEQDERATVAERLREVQNAIRGLSLEVEGLRLNNNSNSDFILSALKDLLCSVNRVLDKVNADLLK